jgi:electron transfer flavoprotein alpha subunit
MTDTILVIAPTEADGSLSRAALEVVTAAVGLGAPVAVGLFGAQTGPAAAQLAGTGVARDLAAEADPLAQPRYATDAAAMVALAKAAGATMILAPSLSRVARAAAGAALRLSGRIDTHVTQVSGGDAPAVSRWYYKQRIEAKLSRAERPWLLLVDPGNYPAATLSKGQGERTDGGGAVPALRQAQGERELIEVALGAELQRTRVTGQRSPTSGEQTIRPEAKLLFVAGAGWTKKQADGASHPEKAGELILGFLRASQASLGTSKSLTDQAGEGQAVLSFMSHLNQVGQTGSTPRHPRGLATCCHGEEPHVVGWRFIRERRAISLDAGCGWARGKADVLYVADAFAVMEKVNALLVAKR